MVTKVKDDIFQIGIALPESPLKLLNAYLILGKRNLLIDTGFNRPECYKSLMEGLDEIGVKMEDTDIFLTHFHTDHSGLVSSIATDSTTIYIGEIDRKMLKKCEGEFKYWKDITDRYVKEGLPIEVAVENERTNPARLYTTEHTYPYTDVFDGDIIEVGQYKLRCVYTPGHTPGHTCLYCEEQELIFLGDQLLFDITPNITMWLIMEDSLKQYLNSLEKIEKLKVKTALVGHRANIPAYYERIAELKEHHKRRLEDTMRIIAEEAGLNGCEIAGRMKWSIRAANWDSFPTPQKWFALGETLAHLQYLLDEGKIVRRDGEQHTYYLA